MQQGPSQLLKLPFQHPTHLIHCHPTLPYLLRISNNSLENYSMYYDILIRSKHEKAVKSLPLNQVATDISNLHYSNKKLLYTVKNHLHLNQQKQKIHSSDIAHLIPDPTGILLTSACDRYDRTIKIVSTLHPQDSKIQIVGQYNFHYDPISCLYWKNSLSISGDTSGEVALWDVNRCQTVLHRKVHYQAVRFVGTYLDYCENNVFYTVAPEEKRLIFSDLRTNKPIRILANLHSQDIMSVKSTPTGKIIIAYKDIIDIIDIHQQYRITGNFSPILTNKATEMRWTAKSFSFANLRHIDHLLTLGKYAIVGCNNGCIEVYNTDTLECLYGFGLVKYGPIKGLEIGGNGDTEWIVGVGGDGDVYMAQFGGNRGCGDKEKYREMDH